MTEVQPQSRWKQLRSIERNLHVNQIRCLTAMITGKVVIGKAEGLFFTLVSGLLVAGFFFTCTLYLLNQHAHRQYNNNYYACWLTNKLYLPGTYLA